MLLGGIWSKAVEAEQCVLGGGGSDCGGGGRGGHETLKVRDRTGNTGSGERARRHDIG